MIPLSIAELTKRYGDRLAVDDLSLDIGRGTVFGLLGRNGAGKTTAIACVLGLISKTSGKISLFGERLQPRTFDRIAYVPEMNSLDAWMTTRQHTEFRRRCFSRFDRMLMNELIERFEIESDRTLRKLSKGQRQVVALALAFAQRPDLMILDEPATGLDPVMQSRLLDTIVSTAADGVTVLFSSHQIGHVERAAERIGIIDAGRLVLEADVDDLRASRFIVEAVFGDGHLEQRYANGDGNA
ncbi:MAG: ABC transporter ATP-binding protein, partial [Candidatus Eremiobacteraeota bacterium]|nr:ABC transporter ATP-binding protein [Candidatus Eremiobacteraeota bacterium]